MQHKSSKNSFGFSIIELIVGLAILSVIGIAIWNFQRDIFFYNDILSSNLSIQEEVRRNFKTITAEIRSVSPSSLGAYPIYEANSDSFTFYNDIDDDGLKERVRYFLSQNILKKGVLKPSGNPLVYNIADEKISEVIHDIDNGSTPIFNYYDTNYDGTTASLSQPVDIIAIRLVKITIIVDHDPSNQPGPIVFTTQVSMRNLKNNL